MMTVNCSEKELEMISIWMTEGVSKADAYRRVFGDNAQGKTPVSVLASKAFARQHIRDEIERREKARNKAVLATAKAEVEELQKLWSRADAVRRLIEIADACRDERLVDGITKDNVGAVRLERDTIDSLNKLLGYNEPEHIETDTTITVELSSNLAELV